MQTSDTLRDLLTSLEAVSSDTASLNVHARLCNSNPVRDALTPILQDVQRSAGIEGVDTLPKGKKRLRAKDFVKVDRQASDERKGVASRVAAEGSQEDGENTEAVVLDDPASDDELSAFNARLASSEEGEESVGSDIEDLDVVDLEQQLGSEGIKRKVYADRSPDILLSRSTSPASESEPARRSHAPRTSTILPSLSLAGYISGSDGSDIEEIDMAPKKNRPGQRARQAIWEKKYGSKAKHLQQSSQKDRDRGWDPKRGATGGAHARDGRSVPRPGRAGHHLDSSVRSDARPSKVTRTNKVKDDSGPLHPSWEAAKQAKAKATGVPAFSGKKVVFE